jgi:hypothetical protein
MAAKHIMYQLDITTEHHYKRYLEALKYLKSNGYRVTRVGKRFTVEYRGAVREMYWYDLVSKADTLRGAA